jgi:hypothetical protein
MNISNKNIIENFFSNDYSICQDVPNWNGTTDGTNQYNSFCNHYSNSNDCDFYGEILDNNC